MRHVMYTVQMSIEIIRLHARTDRPASPHPRILPINATTLQLQWEEPVTWPATYGVTFYELRMYNSSSGEWREWTIHVPPRNSCNTTYSNDAVTCQAFYDAMGNRNEVSVVISSRHVSRECDGIVFYVSAGNSIGKSDSQALKAAFQTGNKYTCTCVHYTMTDTCQLRWNRCSCC